MNEPIFSVTMDDVVISLSRRSRCIHPLRSRPRTACQEVQEAISRHLDIRIKIGLDAWMISRHL